MMLLWIAIIILLYTLYRLYRYFVPSSLHINPNGKYVLISGCDRGVGHALAIELDRQGFNVLAGVYLFENIALLKEKLSSRANIFHLDITKEEDIDVAFNLVSKETNTLYALVNNAGIISHGHIDWISLKRMRQIMDVNFFGHVAMTKKFLPLLISRRHCRVVNLCSATGIFAFPNTSAYTSSKCAFEAFSDCLRREMSPWDLRVSIIEPGTLRTPMSDDYAENLKKLWNELSSDVQERWGTTFLNSIIAQAVTSPFLLHLDDPNKVVRAIQHALVTKNPRARYRPGWQAKVIYVLYWLPTWFTDMLLAKAVNFVPAGVQHQFEN